MTTPAPQSPEKSANWKTQVYVIGIGLGALFGLAASYLFSRTTEENTEDGKPRRIPTTTVIAIFLSVLGLMRQIAESGKPPQKK